jgi:hypothetical protein
MKGLLKFQGGRFVDYGDVKKGGAAGFFYGKVERSLQLVFLLIVVMLKEERDFFDK